MYGYEYGYRQMQNFQNYNRFIEDLRMSIKGEREAAIYYQRLAELAPNSFSREAVLHAMRDEQRHNQILTNLYVQLTGGQPNVTVQPKVPTNFLSGLEQAVNDELEAAHVYKRMYLNARRREIRDIFYDIMNDEHEHAIKFSYARAMI